MRSRQAAYIPALLLGVALANVYLGMPLDASKKYAGTFWTLLRPYPVLVGITGLAMFAVHGALWAAIKTSKDLANRARDWAVGSGIAVCVLLSASFIATTYDNGGSMVNFYKLPALWAVPVLMVASPALALMLTLARKLHQAFAVSCLGLALAVASIAIALFPNMVPARSNVSLSLTIANASSSPLTLKTMLILAVIGMPVVIAYTVSGTSSVSPGAMTNKRAIKSAESLHLFLSESPNVRLRPRHPRVELWLIRESY